MRTKTSHRFWTDAKVPFVEVRYTLDSAERYKEHWHREFCVGALTEGTTLSKIGGATHVLSPGSLIIIPPEKVHSCNPPEGSLRSYIMVYFDVQWCRHIQDALFGERQHFICPDAFLLKDKFLFDSLLTLADLLSSDALPLEKSERTTLFAADLFLTACHRTTARLDVEKHGHGLIEEVKLYLKQQSELKITLEELAAVFRCNPYHLLRTFKKTVGLPPHAFLLNARIERGKRLLLDGAPPADVAAETGFADQSHFHKTFRRIVAATPAQYQKR